MLGVSLLQVYCVATPPNVTTLVVEPLHNVWFETTFTTGTGSTVTVTFSPVLLQPLAVLTTTYVTTVGVTFVLLNASLMLPLPLPVAGLMPPTDARVQLNVVPVVALVGVYPNVDPLQIAAAVRPLDNNGVG
jgi:hypothetical protein